MIKLASIATTTLSALAITCAVMAVSAPPAAAQTAGNLDCKGCVNSKDIKNKSIKKNDLKRNAVTGAKVKDGSLGGSDIATDSIPATDLSNGAGADFAVNPTSMAQLFALSIVETIYRTVNLTVPSAGQVILNASGVFSGPAGGLTGICSISRDGTLDARNLIIGQVVNPPIIATPFAIAWAESVAAAGTETWNIVCQGSAGLFLANPALTAIFVANRY